MLKVQELTRFEWQTYIENSEYNSVFFQYWWGQVTEQHFAVKFRPLLMSTDAELKVLVPCYVTDVNFRIGFIGYGGPLPLYDMNVSCELDLYHRIMAHLKEYFNLPCIGFTSYVHNKWKYVKDDMQPFISNTTVMSLEKTEDFVFNQTISGNVRTAIRKAQKSNVSIRNITPDIVAQAYKLIIDTQRNNGAGYVTDYDFFTFLASSNSEYSKGFAAYIDDEMLGAAICLFSPKEAFHYLHGWNRVNMSTCFNQLLIWSMVQEAIKRKCIFFNMGESHYKSLLEAKRRWNGVEFPLIRFRNPEK